MRAASCLSCRPTSNEGHQFLARSYKLLSEQRRCQTVDIECNAVVKARPDQKKGADQQMRERIERFVIASDDGVDVKGNLCDDEGDNVGQHHVEQHPIERSHTSPGKRMATTGSNDGDRGIRVGSILDTPTRLSHVVQHPEVGHRHHHHGHDADQDHSQWNLNLTEKKVHGGRSRVVAFVGGRILHDRRTEENGPECDEGSQIRQCILDCIRSRANASRPHGHFGANKTVQGDANGEVGTHRSSDILQKEIESALHEHIGVDVDVVNTEKLDDQCPQVETVRDGGEEKQGAGGDLPELVQGAEYDQGENVADETETIAKCVEKGFS